MTRSSDRYEFENDLSVSEVKNLPDKLPPIDRSKMPASRLEKIYVRREARHTRKGSSNGSPICQFAIELIRSVRYMFDDPKKNRSRFRD